MKVFLTGGSGFVGRATIRQLLANGYEIVALSRSEASDANIMQAVSIQFDHFTCMLRVCTSCCNVHLGMQAGNASKLTVARGDLSDASALGQAMQDCQLVIHAAAKVGFE